MDSSTANVNAPDFPFDYASGKPLVWLNSKPLTLKQLEGKIVLIDFWTYSCINCQRTLPYLQKWWEKYIKLGLVIIGVHSPEFDFEKKVENVKEALKKYEVDWPVVLDNEMQIWQSYANHFWPAKYLIDHKGKIIYTHFGEGNYIETEIKIQEALKEAGFKVPDKLVSGEEKSFFGYSQTPELYFGSFRGRVEKLDMDRPSLGLTLDQIYVIGKWQQEKEFLQHSRETKDLDDLVILSYKAKDVLLVMESEDQKPIKVYITFDGVGLNKEMAGKDIQFDKDARSFVEVTFSTLYNLISAKNFGDHVLRLSTTSDKLRLFAFTFGG